MTLCIALEGIYNSRQEQLNCDKNTQLYIHTGTQLKRLQHKSGYLYLFFWFFLIEDSHVFFKFCDLTTFQE